MSLPLIPAGASTVATQMDLTMMAVLGVTIFFSTIIAASIVFLGIKYHYRRSADRRNPPNFHLGLEIAWTAIPLVVVIGLFLAGAHLFIRIRQSPSDAVEMYVIGRQWMWKLQHPEGRREINELHIPVGYPVKLIMTSEDVIHSFFVPAFRVKQDVLPGRYTTLWFEATRPGTYHLFCAEYCGTSHAQMIGRIVAQTPADYGRWLNGGGQRTSEAGGSRAAALPETDMAKAGAALFKTYRCDDCHKEDDDSRAPALRGLFNKSVALEGNRTAIADETYLRESIVTPNARVVKGYQPNMPTFQGQLDEDQILQLVAYIKSLKEKEASPTAP
jgi:cytochrome c oxidase subunit 2